MIRFQFLEFDMPHISDCLEIGDGMMIGELSRLVRFSGQTLPTNVTSVSHSAWLKVTLTEPGQRVGSYIFNLKLEVTSVEIMGGFG